MISRRGFRRLTEHNHRVTSPSTPDYNCIAWAAGDTNRWWQPGGFWPTAPHPDDYGLGILVEAFHDMGFEECGDGEVEAGYEKVALYGSGFFYTHASRQLSSGKWTSKLGRSEDIEHDSPDDLTEGIYGEVQQYMRRPIASG
jgi:hypothetical protein